MANSDKNILISPRRGSSTDVPSISFVGQSNSPIDLDVLDDNALRFSGSEGELLTVNNNNTSGLIFAAADISGVPGIFMDSSGAIGIAPYFGSVVIGTSKLTAGSDVTIGGVVDFSGTVAFSADLQFDGAIDRGTMTYHDLFIRGTGLNHNEDREVRVNGAANIVSNNRGLRLVIFNKGNLSVVSNNNYDTYGDSSASNNLATALNNMTEQQIGVLTSYDAFENQYTTSLRQAFWKLGLSKAAVVSSATAGNRQSYCSVFLGGSNNDGNRHAIEVHQGNDSDSPHSTLSVKIWTRKDGADPDFGGIGGGNGVVNALYSTDISSTMPVVYADHQNKLVINPDKDTDFFSAGAIVDVRKSYNTTNFDNFREEVSNSTVLLTTDKADNAYSGALIWRSDNNNASEPKAGIWLKTTNRQTSELHFGTTSHESNGLRIADYDETRQETFFNPLGNLYNPSYIERSAHFEEPDERQNSSATGRWVTMEPGTVYVGHLGRGTKVYRKTRSNGNIDTVVNATGNPGYTTFSVSTGDEFWANAPVGYYPQATQEDIVPLAYNGMNFGYWTQRYYTGRVKIYSPGGSSVAFYEGSVSALTGSAAHTANIGPGEVLDWAIDDTQGYHIVRVTGGSPVVMTKRGTSGDRSIIPPMSRHIVMPYGGNVSNATITTSSSLERVQNLNGTAGSSAYRNGGTNRYTFWHEEYPIWGEQLADAAGGDMDMHIPFCMLSNYYIVPRGPLPYNAAFVYPNSRFQIWYWDGSNWGLHRSVTIYGDPFAGTGYGEGRQYNYDNIGPGTDTVAVYSCNKPFALRMNDRANDEFVYQGHHMRNPIWMGLPVR